MFHERLSLVYKHRTPETHPGTAPYEQYCWLLACRRIRFKKVTIIMAHEAAPPTYAVVCRLYVRDTNVCYISFAYLDLQRTIASHIT
jgi:hypothetical protein